MISALRVLIERFHVLALRKTFSNFIYITRSPTSPTKLKTTSEYVQRYPSRTDVLLKIVNCCLGSFELEVDFRRTSRGSASRKKGKKRTTVTVLLQNN